MRRRAGTGARLLAVPYYLASLGTFVRAVRNWATIFRDLAGLPVRRPYPVRLRDGAIFRVRCFMDAWIVKEVYIDRDYERHGPALQPGWTVVDIGAHLGSFTVVPRHRGRGAGPGRRVRPLRHRPLKLDCEGGEFEILLNAPAELLRRVRHICLEYHNAATSSSDRDLLRRLAGLGLHTRRSPNLWRPHQGLIHAYQPGDRS